MFSVFDFSQLNLCFFDFIYPRTPFVLLVSFFFSSFFPLSIYFICLALSRLKNVSSMLAMLYITWTTHPDEPFIFFHTVRLMVPMLFLYHHQSHPIPSSSHPIDIASFYLPSIHPSIYPRVHRFHSLISHHPPPDMLQSVLLCYVVRFTYKYDLSLF